MHRSHALSRARTEVRAASQLLLSTAGFHQPETRIAADARRFWHDRDHATWRSDFHFRDADIFRGNEIWSEMGERHLRLAEQALALAGYPSGSGMGRIVDWGCGGGANAVALAPHASEVIGVDVADDALAECATRLAEVTPTPFRPVLVDVAEPEQALDLIREPCDLFVSFYVFELLTSPAQGERILHVAQRLLAPGGVALIQIAYDDGRLRSRPRRWDYRANPAAMTTYPLDGFWSRVRSCGLRPEWVHLRPQDELGQRYAYVAMTKPADAL